jgi:hypothetical protein
MLISFTEILLKNYLVDKRCHTMKTFKESGDLPATERWTAVKDRCPGVSAL